MATGRTVIVLEGSVLDLIFLAITVAFFALSVGYVALCNRLIK